MMPRLGVVMDPIASIKPGKDSTLAMLLDAQRRGWTLEYIELQDLRLRDGCAEATLRPLTVHDDAARWFELGTSNDARLGDLDIILMRKDPPFDVEFLAATYILERAEADGALVVNRPRALRDANEKMFTAWFPQCCPPSLVTRSKPVIREFLQTHGTIVVKPLYAMGGRSVFVLRAGDPNVSVVLEEMTHYEQRYVMAQAFIDDVATSGDKRILLIDGVPVPHAITRIPPAGELRANLATGATPYPVELSERDQWICAQVGPALRERGIVFAGLDVIGGFLTEINVTSPTCIREIDRFFGVNVAGMLLDALEQRLRMRIDASA